MGTSIRRASDPTTAVIRNAMPALRASRQLRHSAAQPLMHHAGGPVAARGVLPPPPPRFRSWNGTVVGRFHLRERPRTSAFSSESDHFGISRDSEKDFLCFGRSGGGPCRLSGSIHLWSDVGHLRK